MGNRLKERIRYYKSLIGKRLLLMYKKTYNQGNYIEVKVLEVTPLGFIKAEYMSGNPSWEGIVKFEEMFEVIEILKGKEKK